MLIYLCVGESVENNQVNEFWVYAKYLVVSPEYKCYGTGMDEV